MIDLKDFLPGFSMGFVRAIISHPFEILKIKSQLNHNTSFKGMFRGLKYSICSNAVERGIQFGIFEKIKHNQNTIIAAFQSSLISTSIGLPYSILLIRNTILNNTAKSCIPYRNLGVLEYCRNLTGSTIFLYSYEKLKEKNIPIIYRAPISSCITWMITYPIDSYKNLRIAGKIPKITTSLYRGIQYPIIRSFPSSIAGFYVYEYIYTIIK